MSAEPPEARAVLDFWFRELAPADWWSARPDIDALIHARFDALHRRAAQGELHAWRQAPRGRLAEVIVLDQFSRNIFRGTPGAFAQDAQALVLAQEAIAAGADAALEPAERAFLYMPYMHSESPAIHALAVQLFSAPGMEANLDAELRHRAIIERFGRYPHRNAIIGRISTPEEIAFLGQPGSRF
jgi:uncharacterized protein (DUF924 family)